MVFDHSARSTLQLLRPWVGLANLLYCNCWMMSPSRRCTILIAPISSIPILDVLLRTMPSVFEKIMLDGRLIMLLRLLVVALTKFLVLCLKVLMVGTVGSSFGPAVLFVLSCLTA